MTTAWIPLAGTEEGESIQYVLDHEPRHGVGDKLLKYLGVLVILRGVFSSKEFSRRYYWPDSTYTKDEFCY